MATTHAPPDRSFVAVDGASGVLAAALDAGAPHAAARRLRELAPTLDVADARAVSQRDGRGVVIAAHAGAALAVRWLAPGAATAVHEHGGWGAAVVVDGHDRYERYELSDGHAVLDTTFWLGPGDAVSWLAPPGDVHRQEATDGGATELVLVSAPPIESHAFTVTDGLGAARPLTDALLAAYRTQRFAPLREHYHDEVLVDVNVPSWRFQLTGLAALEVVIDRDEFGLPDLRLRSFRALPTADGCAAEVDVRARRGAEAVQWRALHVLRVRAGKVVEHVTYCSGHWAAATIAAHDADAAMVRP